MVALDNIRLYQVLGLPRTDASPEDIKKCYRKMAVRCHPDRNLNDPDSTSKFQAVQYAYSILSNPKLRSIYDSYGEQGLKMYESYVNFAEGNADDSGPTMVPLAPAQLVSVVCGAIGILVLLFTALCVNLLLKLNGTTDAKLSLLLIPLWILDAFAVLAVYIFLFTTARKGHPSQGAMGAAVVLLLHIAFQVLVCVRLDGAAPTQSWLVVFVPLFVTEAIDLAKAVVRCRPSAHESEKAAGKAHPVYLWHVLLTLGWSAARIVTVVLIPLRLDAALSINWWLVFMPLFSYVLLYLCFGCQQLGVPVHNEREQMLQMGHRLCLLFTTIATVLLILATLTLNGTISTWLPVFILPFTVSGCFCCCCCCVVMCIRMVPKGGPVDVPPGDGMEPPGGTASGSTSPPTPSEDAPLLSKSPGRV